MHTHNHLTALCTGLPGWASTRRNIHPLTSILIIRHPFQLPSSTMIHSVLLVQSACLTDLFHNLSQGPLWSFSCSWTSTSYSIHSFFSHHMSIQSQPVLLSFIPNRSLSSLLGNLFFTLTPHINLTILISARWSATSFSFLTGQVSFPCNILLRTQLLYKFPL